MAKKAKVETDAAPDEATPAIAAIPVVEAKQASGIELPVTREQVAQRIKTCRMVATNIIRNPHAPPSDGILPKCLAEIDALERIIPTEEAETSP